MTKEQHTMKNTLLLVLTAIIWGLAFVFQSMGAKYVGAYTFFAARSWLAFFFLIPVVAVSSRRKSGSEKRKMGREEKKQLLIAGCSIGFLLFVASVLQQTGIAYTTAAKSGFITAMYVVLVPVISLFLGSSPSKNTWIGVALGVCGLYFLCMTDGIGGINQGDILTLICALMFSLQILTINHFVQYVDSVRLCQMEMLFAAIFSTIGMLLFEHPTKEGLMAALIPILYAGIMSSGVGYTLQIVGQEGVNPTVASLVMSLESVFSAIGGWMILGEGLTMRELSGCIMMFIAIVIAQLPNRKRSV